MYHGSKVKKSLLGIPKYIFMLFFVLIAIGPMVWAFLSFDKGMLNNLMEGLGQDPKQWLPSA